MEPVGFVWEIPDYRDISDSLSNTFWFTRKTSYGAQSDGTPSFVTQGGRLRPLSPGGVRGGRPTGPPEKILPISAVFKRFR